MNRAREQQPKPLARTRDLVVREASNELSIYDPDNDEAHCLNKSAALIWKNCNGTTTIPRLAELLALELQSPIDEDFIRLALDQLQEFDLLQREIARQAGMPVLSRRRVMKGSGLAAVVALPLVISLVAQTALQAQTVIVIPPPK
jgi:Coenzyme PQQ synthesis protein D (PqqD)